MSDYRDTNHDGHVSLSEKIKDKLHLHRKNKKDKKGTRTSDLTGHSGYPVAQPANHAAAYGSHTGASHTLNQDHRLSTGEKLAGTTALGAGALGAAGSGFHDSRDLNHDGHVSMGEKLQTRTSGSSSSSEFNHNGHSTVFHDSRDLNHDGHVSMGEKLHTSGSSGTGFHDSRDLNHDGRVSMGEKLQTHSSGSSSTGFHDSRDLNHDGHVSMAEKLEASTGMEMEEQARIRLHEEQLAVSKRAVSAGGVDLVKRVQEEQVERSVPVIRQEVVMERRPYSGDDSTRVPEKDEIARVILYREEVVTEKRIVPVEEVVVRKDLLTEQRTVGAVLRSEYVETSQTGAASGAYGHVGAATDAHGYTGGPLSPGKRLKSDVNVPMKAARG